MRILVQKFGGTSVARPDLREKAAQKVRDALDDGLSACVVVSAMGRTGDPYATDTLLGLLPTDARATGDEVDLLLSCGEVISSVIFAAELRRMGLEPAVLTGGQAGIITDGAHREARVLRIDASRLLGLLEAGKVPVVAGFQGVTESGEVTTLGRGGSDTTAAALGVALHAERVDIYTDVSGIMTADPRLVKEAGILGTMDYDEIFQMAALGAKVIHPRAVEIARQSRVPLRVLGLEGEGAGTVIQARDTFDDVWQNRKPERSVHGVSVLADMVQFRVRTPQDPLERQRTLFKALAGHAISVDLINVFPDYSSFLVASTARDEAERILTGHLFDYTVNAEVAKVSIVGTAIQGLPGVMSLVVDALAEKEIPILASSDSHQSISCLVPRDQAGEAATALHRAFSLGVRVREEEKS